MKIRAHFIFGTKFVRIYNFGLISSIPSSIFIISMFHLLCVPNFITWRTFQFWDQILQICTFRSSLSIPINILIISIFDLFWLPSFIKTGHISILRPNLFKFIISGQDAQFQISYLWFTNLTCSYWKISISLEYISFLGPNFPRMRELIVALMSNMCYLDVVLSSCYCSLPSGFCLLLLVT